MYPLTTTTERIDACNPCRDRRARGAQLLGITEPSDAPIAFSKLLDVLGFDDALWCCRAEPDLAPIWRRYAVWCGRQVQHLMTDARSLTALDVAEAHANGLATDEDLAVARTAAHDAALAAARAARAARAATRNPWAAIGDAGAAAWAAWAATWAAGAGLPGAAADAPALDAARQHQANAFRQLVDTGIIT